MQSAAKYNLNLSEIKYVYLLGMGGIGMSALARYFNAQGKKVSGYDKTPTPLTDAMISEGINIHFDDNINFFRLQTINYHLPTILIIYTPAIPKDQKEFIYFKDNGYLLKKRSEILGMITKESFTIAVAGTHGKTTTTAMITHILKYSGIDCTAFVGGIMTNYNTNILIGKWSGTESQWNRNQKSGTKNIIVVEADEYDRSFLTLHPDIAVITSMDADHLDIYGEKENLVESFNLFAKQVKENGTLIHKKNLPVKKIHRETIDYSVKRKADYNADNINVRDGNFVYDAGKIKDISLAVPGRHNVENSLAAIAVAQKMGISGIKIKSAIESFKGVKRRFEYIIKNKEIIFIDDYAHHPEELKACISAAKELYPEKKITGIFQPHLFSRTRDFADEFARSLELLDELILLDIYPAREVPLEGVDSKMLLDKIRSGNKILCKKNDLVNLLSKKNIEVLITLGAGDIDALVRPISETLQAKYKFKKNHEKQ